MDRKQCKAARAMLEWRQIDLAERAQVAVSTIRTYEAGRTVPKPVTLQLLQRALEAAGIEFLPGGVRVR